MRFKAEIKRDIEKILIEKKVAGDSRSLILNSLVNYTYARLKKQREINQDGAKNENNRGGGSLLQLL